jgi:hypothetical protein
MREGSVHVADDPAFDERPLGPSAIGALGVSTTISPSHALLTIGHAVVP